MSNERMFLSPPHLGDAEQRLVAEAFASNYVAPLGPMVDGFEADMAAFTGIPHCLGLASGTAAMHLALHCLGVGPGDVVVASTLTFIASVAPACYRGATPVFVDSDAATWNMDPALLAEAIAKLAAEGRLPKAVVPTDLYGQCADYDAIRAVCAPYGIPVVGDAAEAMGATYKGHHAGCGLRAAIFSFNGNKIITTGGGGMLASDDPDLIARARRLSTQNREPVPWYEHVELGYNYRLSNVLAAIGRGQLQVLPERVRQRRAIRERYAAHFADVPGISLMPEAAYGVSNGWLTVILVDPATDVQPETVRLALNAENIEARPLWKPMHRQPVFAGCEVFGGACSEELFRTGLCLPSGSAMTPADVDRVADRVRAVVTAEDGR